MTDIAILTPVIGHMITAVLLLFFWNRDRPQMILSVAGNLAILAYSVFLAWRCWDVGILVTQAGNWSAPFGITFVADIFSSTMIVLTGIAGLAVGVFSIEGVSKARIMHGYYPLLHFLLMGLNGAFLAGDLFNLYVWFEVIIISSFVLMTLGGKKSQILGGIKYVTLNMLASVIFLTAIAILYGLTGSLNMADLAVRVSRLESPGILSVCAIFFFVAFGIKSALFPLYFWLPSSYHTPPSAIVAIFGGLLTKVGVYAMMRVFTLIFVPDSFMGTVFAVAGTATLITGALGAVNKKDIRRMFSYLIVCHIGYLVAGLGMYTEKAMTGSIYYLIHDVVIKTNIFLVAGIIHKIKGTMDMTRLGGLYTGYPYLSLLMAFVFFSLVGIPPLSGFWPKIFLFEAGFDTQSYVLTTAIALASFITLLVLARMWTEVFWKNAPESSRNFVDYYRELTPSRKAVLAGPVIFLMAVSLYIGLDAEGITVLSKRIASDLMNPSPYIRAVLHQEIDGSLNVLP